MGAALLKYHGEAPLDLWCNLAIIIISDWWDINLLELSLGISKDSDLKVSPTAQVRYVDCSKSELLKYMRKRFLHSDVIIKPVIVNIT